jgi:hypothetical protein
VYFTFTTNGMLQRALICETPVHFVKIESSGPLLPSKIKMSHLSKIGLEDLMKLLHNVLIDDGDADVTELTEKLYVLIHHWNNLSSYKLPFTQMVKEDATFEFVLTYPWTTNVTLDARGRAVLVMKLVLVSDWDRQNLAKDLLEFRREKCLKLKKLFARDLDKCTFSGSQLTCSKLLPDVDTSAVAGMSLLDVHKTIPAKMWINDTYIHGLCRKIFARYHGQYPEFRSTNLLQGIIDSVIPHTSFHQHPTVSDHMHHGTYTGDYSIWWAYAEPGEPDEEYGDAVTPELSDEDKNVVNKITVALRDKLFGCKTFVETVADENCYIHIHVQ